MHRGLLATGLVLLAVGSVAAGSAVRLAQSAEAPFMVWALASATLAGSAGVLFTWALRSRVGVTPGFDHSRFSRFRMRLYFECLVLLMAAWFWLDTSASGLEKLVMYLGGVILLHIGIAISDAGYRFFGMPGVFFHHIIEDARWLVHRTG